MTLTLIETENRIKTTNFDSLPKPRKNKGVRGQLLELALGIPNSSKLTDVVDGELKSVTKGESVAVILIIQTNEPLWSVYHRIETISYNPRMGLTFAEMPIRC